MVCHVPTQEAVWSDQTQLFMVNGCTNTPQTTRTTKARLSLPSVRLTFIMAGYCIDYLRLSPSFSVLLEAQAN